MNGQLELFESPKPQPKLKGGSLPRGSHGLLLALLQQGLTPDALEPAARLVALLDEDAGGKR
jgi:hypothetical protein